MEYNRAKSSVTHDNAYTNNTFNLSKVLKWERYAKENSYRYLEEVQESYINVRRFNFTNEDLILNANNKACVTCEIDFIKSINRKAYKRSDFYNKYLSLDNIKNNRDIFLYIPLVLIDGQSLFSYKIKTLIDGQTEVVFDFIKYPEIFMNESHTIEIVFFDNTEYDTLSAYNVLLDSHNSRLLVDAYVPKLKNRNIVFAFLQCEGDTYGSNICQLCIQNIDGKDYFIFDEYIRQYMMEDKVYNIYLYSSPELYQVADISSIYDMTGRHMYSDEDKTSRAITVIEPSVGDTYVTPIPNSNLVIIRRDTETGELVYMNDLSIFRYYPNIYEIMSNDEPQLYEYIVYYFYRACNDYLKYRNRMKYMYNAFMRKTGLTLQHTFENLLYFDYPDVGLQQFFNEMISKYVLESSPNTINPEYVFNMNDLQNNYDSYDFDYKIEKMKQFIEYDPFILQSYGKDVSTKYEKYYLDMRYIDISGRVCVSNLYIGQHDRIIPTDSRFRWFAGECYSYIRFIFNSDQIEDCDLRIFVNGILCDSYHIDSIDDYKVLYISSYYFKDIKQATVNIDGEEKVILQSLSYVEIEKFNSYTFKAPINLNDDYTDIKFEDSLLVDPTLNDLFFTDENGNKLDRTKFRIYNIVDLETNDVSDYVNMQLNGMDISEYVSGQSFLDNDIVLDSKNDKLYMLIDDGVIIDDTGEKDTKSLYVDGQLVSSDFSNRMILKYMVLNKLRIVCTDATITSCIANIYKKSFIASTRAVDRCLPSIMLFNGSDPWIEHKSFIRTFVNGKLKHLDYDIYQQSPFVTHLVPRSYLEAGDVITVDVSPYSYDLEYYSDEIDESYTITFDPPNDGLSKPFDVLYYDMYLNGVKLSDNNVQVLSPTKIKIFNVHSRKNLYVYRKDRDIEYFGFTKTYETPFDEILSSDVFTDDDKDNIINDVIYDYHDDIIPADDSDTSNSEDREMVPDIVYDKYRFYLDKLLPKGKLKPNTFYLNNDEIATKYSDVYELYSNKKDRLVIQPNKKYDADTVLLVGRNDAMTANVIDEVYNVNNQLVIYDYHYTDEYLEWLKSQK